MQARYWLSPAAASRRASCVAQDCKGAGPWQTLPCIELRKIAELLMIWEPGILCGQDKQTHLRVVNRGCAP